MLCLYKTYLLIYLSDIQMGVFKIKNIYELESRINLIKDNENIISIELNTLDPTIKPR